MQKLAERFPNSPHALLAPLPRLDVAAARSRAAALARAAARDPGRRQPGRRRLPGLGGRADGGGEPAAAARRCSRPTTSSTRASSRSGRRICFLGEPRGSWEVLPNAVDVSRFTPAEAPPAGGPVLLLGGDQTQAYRLELALRTLAALLPRHPDARLLVTGRLVSPVEPLVAELGLAGRVELVGEYAQRDAPAIFRRAHLLLHTKVKDPCPTLVLEAMASRAPGRAPGERRHGRARRRRGRESACRTRTRGSATSRRRRRRSRTRSSACSPICLRTAAAARARAVERFALEPWLERHARAVRRARPRR